MGKRIRIGLLVDYLVSEYSEFLIDGVEACCKKVDADFYIFQMGVLQDTSQNFDYQYVAITAFLSSNNIDGLIFCSTTQTHYMDLDSYISYLNSYYPLPIVNIGLDIPGIPSVEVQYEDAFRALVEHVVRDIGVRKVGLMSVDSHSDEVVLREKIFWQVMKEYGIPFNSVTVWKAKFSYSSAIYELNKSIKPDDPFDYDTIIALNDDMAIAVMDFAKLKGVSVPEQLAVTGFDDLRKASFSEPSLSTVNQMIFQQGYVAARTLYDKINGKDVPTVQTIDAKAVLRNSTGATEYFNKVRNNDFIEIDRVALADMGNNFAASEWYHKRSQIYTMSKLYMSMQADITEEEMINHLTYNIKALGIPYVFVAAFDKPEETDGPFDYFHLPHEASVLCCYDEKQGVVINTYSPKYFFDPNEIMIPQDLLPKSQNPLVVMSLFNGKIQYGYIIVEKTDFDIAVYDTLRSTVSLLLTSIQSFKSLNGNDNALKEKYAALDRIAHTDELTGLMNRRGLYDFGQKSLELAASMQQRGLVIYGDLDGLKSINDNFGHEAGDKAIIAAATILKTSFRSTDFVARVGGDEFVIVSTGLSKEMFDGIKQKIEERCIEWTTRTNSLFLLSISLGCVEFPFENNYDLTMLLSQADTKLYEVKKNKK